MDVLSAARHNVLTLLGSGQGEPVGGFQGSKTVPVFSPHTQEPWVRACRSEEASTQLRFQQ